MQEEVKKKMITYDPLWETMKSKSITQYKLIKEKKISAGQLSRLRANSYVSTHTVDMLCQILDCQVQDIMRYETENPRDDADAKNKTAQNKI